MDVDKQSGHLQYTVSRKDWGHWSPSISRLYSAAVGFSTLLIYRAVDFSLPDRLAFVMKARNGSVVDASGSEPAPFFPH